MTTHDASRRDFLRAATAAGAGGVWAAAGSALSQDRDAAQGLPITVAGYRFDRVAALADGRVGIEGCDVAFEQDAIGDMNTHVFEGPRTREVTESGLHPFMLAYANEGFRDYALLPIFPRRMCFPRESRSLRGRPVSTSRTFLVSGEVDALFHAVEPRAFVEGHPDVARLFLDPRAMEQDYFTRTGIFPIVYAVAIRRDVAREHRWLSQAVFDAYAQAKRMSYADMSKRRWFLDMLPWYGQELEETRAVMGDNFYSYGVASNRKTLETLFRYSHEQGLASRELKVEELFEPASLSFSEPASQPTINS